MPKQIDLTDNLEQYIIDNSESLTDVQKEIIEYNINLGDQKKLQVSVSQAQLLQILIVACILHLKKLGLLHRYGQKFLSFFHLLRPASLPKIFSQKHMQDLKLT